MEEVKREEIKRWITWKLKFSSYQKHQKQKLNGKQKFRFFQFIVIHTVKGFGIVNKAEIDVFLELSCFFDDPADVGNLISGSSAFSKTSLNIWKFTVYVKGIYSLIEVPHTKQWKIIKDQTVIWCQGLWQSLVYSESIGEAGTGT